jgi:hypothetical protein
MPLKIISFFYTEKDKLISVQFYCISVQFRGITVLTTLKKRNKKTPAEPEFFYLSMVIVISNLRSAV